MEIKLNYRVYGKMPKTDKVGFSIDDSKTTLYST